MGHVVAQRRMNPLQAAIATGDNEYGSLKGVVSCNCHKNLHVNVLESRGLEL